MGFTEAVLWWEGWQLRFLVLDSLFIQCFLFFASILRKRCIPSWLRFLIWLAYLGSDKVAIYALATLYNRNKEQEWVSTHRSSTSLQVLWAPILLVHLGGQDAITAYNIEDNELWRRHVPTAVSQVTLAVYVFSKSWSGDKRILAAAALLFFAGILKCVLKQWDLKRVSINSLVDSSNGSEENGKIRSLDEFVRAAKEYFQYDERDRAHDLLRWDLAAIFERLYTKKGTMARPSCQYNLIGYLARNQRYRTLRKVSTLLVCKDYLDQLWCMKPCKSSGSITDLVHGYIKTADSMTTTGASGLLSARDCSTSSVGACRGHSRRASSSGTSPRICFQKSDPPPVEASGARSRSRVVSNYMAYLLFVNPDMLIPGARRSLFRAAYCQLKKLLKVIPQRQGAVPLQQNLPREEAECAKKIANNIQHATEIDGEGLSIVHDAWILAEGLMDFQRTISSTQEIDQRMWSVIQGVWLEMLCFSAGRCRGYLHAKRLGQGGEYLTYVWLLLSYMGMETLAERMQRTELQEEARNSSSDSADGATAAASPARATGGNSNGTTAVTPAIGGGGHGDGTTEASPVMATGGRCR